MEIKNYPWYPTHGITGTGIKLGEGVNRDRDPDQGAQQGEKQPKTEPNPYLARLMTDEEFEQALKKLQLVRGYKEANLSYRVEKNADGRRVVVILDPQQTIIRRITEAELGAAFLMSKPSASEKGGLLDKSA